MRVEALGLDQALAREPEPTLAFLFRSMIRSKISMFVPWLRGSGGSRKDKQLAVGEDAIHVEEKKFDLAGAGLSREFGHRGILAPSIPDRACAIESDRQI